MAARDRVLRVLVVDDNKDAADSLARLVRQWGHEVQIAYDATAVDVARTFEPDVILLDIGLPRTSGITIAQSVRQERNSQQTLIIAVTGYHDQAPRALAMDAGIDYYLVKPVDPRLLEQLLATRQQHIRDL